MPTAKELAPTFTDDRGAAVRMVRRFKVPGLTVPGFFPDLRAAALAATGIPAVSDVPVGLENLIAVNHSVSIIDRSTKAGGTCVAEVEVEYVRKADSGLGFVFSKSPGLVQEATQRDVFGVGLVVTHNGDSQVATATNTFATVAARATGLIQRDNINLTIGEWMNLSNSRYWNGGAAGTWLCFAFEVTEHDESTTPPTYSVTVEFQWKQDGWNEEVFYVSSDNSIPPDVVPGVGVYTAQLHGARRYQDLFPD